MKIFSIIVICSLFSFYNNELLKYEIKVGHSVDNSLCINIKSLINQNKFYIKTNDVEVYYFDNEFNCNIFLKKDVSYFYISDNAVTYLKINILKPKIEEYMSINNNIIYFSYILTCNSSEVKIAKNDYYIKFINEKDYLEINQKYVSLNQLFQIEYNSLEAFNSFILIKKRYSYYSYLDYSNKYRGFILPIEHEIIDNKINLFFSCYYKKGSFELASYHLSGFEKTNKLFLSDKVTEIALILNFKEKIIIIPFQIYTNTYIGKNNISIIENSL